MPAPSPPTRGDLNPSAGCGITTRPTLSRRALRPVSVDGHHSGGGRHAGQLPAARTARRPPPPLQSPHPSVAGFCTVAAWAATAACCALHHRRDAAGLRLCAAASCLPSHQRGASNTPRATAYPAVAYAPPLSRGGSNTDHEYTSSPRLAPPTAAVKPPVTWRWRQQEGHMSGGTGG